MKKEKVFKTIKIATIMLAIVLISMISFFGIYKEDRNQMNNQLKDYKFSMALNGFRDIKISVSGDSENSTKENYIKAKRIIENRLNKIGVQEYNISLNEDTGTMDIEIPENSNTDTVVSQLSTVGKFEIVDSKTEEVLLNNDNIKTSKVLYSNATSGTTVYLDIEFNKEGKEKLEEITKTYATVKKEEDNNATQEETQEAEDETEQKQIIMKIDGESIITTSFDEPITTGKLQLSVGRASTDNSVIQDYVKQAQNIATTLDSGNLPVEYKLEKNQYILSDVSSEKILEFKVIVSAVILIELIAFIVRYKTTGLVAVFSYVGLAAIYLLVIRYTNVIISLESIFAIMAILLLNFIFTDMLLKNLMNKTVKKAVSETYKEFFIKLIPICIMVIAFSFTKWIPLSSFGMTSFWGIVLIAIYNAVITKMLFKMKLENK